MSKLVSFLIFFLLLKVSEAQDTCNIYNYPIDAIIIVDESGSAGSYLNSQINYLQNFVSGISEYLFNDGINLAVLTQVNADTLVYWTTDQNGIITELNNISAVGIDQLGNTLELALQMLKDKKQNGRGQAVFILF